jgi:Rrf2 family protein
MPPTVVGKIFKVLAQCYFETIVVTVMANNVQFSIAVHILAGLACGCDQNGVTSGHLAASVNTSPSFVRRTLAKLSKAGLVETATGKAGACWLARDAKRISLLDIYQAVDAPRAALEKALTKTQKALEAGLAEISLAQIVSDVKKR